MWGPSSPFRDGTGTPAMDAQRLNPGLPGKSHFGWTLMFTKYCIKIVFILIIESFRIPLKFPPESSIALTPNWSQPGTVVILSFTHSAVSDSL